MAPSFRPQILISGVMTPLLRPGSGSPPPSLQERCRPIKNGDFRRPLSAGRVAAARRTNRLDILRSGDTGGEGLDQIAGLGQGAGAVSTKPSACNHLVVLSQIRAKGASQVDVGARAQISAMDQGPPTRWRS